jgi:galactokinase
MTANMGWFQPATEVIGALPRSDDLHLRGFLQPDRPLLIARAPGRLDVMGGIADYSGSVVLELPLARATFAILQGCDGGNLEIVSVRRDGVRHFSIDLQMLAQGALSTPEGIGRHAGEAGEGWAAYVLGVVQLCIRLTDAQQTRENGFRLLIHSDIPEGKGISSSAALEVAVMAAAAAHLGVELEAAELAAACQWVENHVVGAPCGIMDQLTAALGRQDRLLRLRCQPALVEGHLEIPSDYHFFGIDSGVRHAVSGADYSTVRAAAFMGYRIIAEAAGLEARLEAELAFVDDPRWGGYLANLTPQELGQCESRLPERMRGEDFLRRFGGHTDLATSVRPELSYPVRQATRHPVLENRRVERFAALLEELPRSPEAAVEMGRLMYGSHESYGACGLGSAATDRLVEMVRQRGPREGLYGAKITGGGSGGTVAILGVRDAEPAVREIATRFGEEVGMPLEVFAESGPGLMVQRV